MRCSCAGLRVLHGFFTNYTSNCLFQARPVRSTRGQLPARLVELARSMESIVDQHQACNTTSRDRMARNRSRQAESYVTVHDSHDSLDLDFEHSVSDAQLLFAEGSGFNIHNNHNDSDSSSLRVMEPINGELMLKRIADYVDAMAPDKPISKCASCGMLSVPGQESFRALHIDDAGCLQFSDEALENFLKFEARDSYRLTRTTKLVDGKYYHLHDFDLDDEGALAACPSCHDSIIAGMMPEFNVGNGRDFGVMQACCSLTVAEEIAASAGVPFFKSMKLTAEGLNIMTGHVICFEHNGRMAVPAHCSKLPRSDVADILSVSFIGSKEDWQAIQGSPAKRRSFFSKVPQLTISPSKVLQFLEFKKQVDPDRYGHIEIDYSLDLHRQLLRVPDAILDAALLGQDEEIIRDDVQRSDDVANLDRGTQHAAASQADAEPVELEPVFVCPEVTARSVSDYMLFRRLQDTLMHRPSEYSSRHIHATVASHPLDEIRNNDELLIGLFPQLFLLGEGLRKGCGALRQKELDHLLLQHDGRFAKAPSFLFILFNQMQRHASYTSVAVRVRAEHHLIRKFQDITNSHDFDDRLERAVANPNAADAKKLSRELLPTLRLSGASIPHSRFERESAFSRMLALMYYAGPFSLFVTIAPADMDSAIMLRLSGEVNESMHENGEISFNLPSLRKRKFILAKNPYMAAMYYKSLIECLMKFLVGLDLSHRTKKSHAQVHQRGEGIFGVPIVYAGVTELQARHSLHNHFIITTDLSPVFIRESISNPTIRSMIQDRMDSIVQTWIPESANSDGTLLCDGPQFDEPTLAVRDNRKKLDCSSIDTVLRRGFAVAKLCNCHTHSATCHKGITGKWRCRFGLPSGSWPRGTTFLQLVGQEDDGKFVPLALREMDDDCPVSDPLLAWQDQRTIILQLHRPDQSYHPSEVEPDNGNYWVDIGCGDQSNVVSFSPLLSAALNCNTCVEPLGGLTQSKTVSFYLLKYITKDAGDLTQVMSMIKAARATVLKYPSRAENSGTEERNSQHLITRLLNIIGGEQEYGGQIASLALQGFPSNIYSHDFAYCYWRPALAFIKARQGAQSSSPEVDSGNCDSTSECSTESENEAAEVEASRSVPIHHDFDEEDDLPGLGTETIAVAQDGSVMTVSQFDHYRFRSAALQQLSYYEYCGIVSIVAKQDEEGDQPKTAGRNANLRIAFAPQHPQFATHEQRLRSKQLVPLYAGPAPPAHPGAQRKESAVWKRKAQRFAEFAISMHHPWDLESHVPGIPMTFASLQIWTSRMADGLEGFVGSARLFWLRCVSTAFHSDAKQMKLISAWRSRHARLWNLNERELHGDKPHSQSDKEKDNEHVDLALSSLQQLHDMLDPNGAESDSAKRGSAVSQYLIDCFDNIPINSSQSGQLSSSNNQSAEIQDARRISTVPPIRYDDQPSGHIAQLGKVLRTAVSSEDQDSGIESTLPLSSGNNFDSNQMPGSGSQASYFVDESPDSIHLNKDQNVAFVRCLQYVNALQLYNSDPIRRACPVPLKIMICGMAGTGKSYFINKLLQRINGRITINCAAATGSAAAGLPGGRTLHSLMGISAHSGSLDMSTNTVTRCKQMFGSARFLVIDEISLVSAQMFEQVDRRLRQWFNLNMQFGGIAMILMGDLFQIPAPGKGLVSASVDASSYAGRLFNEFETINFNQQMRAAEDAKHAELLSYFNNPDKSHTPVRKSKLLTHLQVLKPSDFYFGSLWCEATIVVADNATRHAINKCRVKQMAILTNQPIIAWTHKLHKRTEACFSAVAEEHGVSLKRVLSKHNELVFYFLHGAPAMLTENISVERRLTNGTICTLHSLTLDASLCDVEEEWLRIDRADAGDIVFLQAPPLSINVSLSEEVSAKWNEDEALSVADKCVIPLLQSQTAQEFKLSSNKTTRSLAGSSTAKKMSMLRCYDYGVELAFAITYHKV